MEMGAIDEQILKTPYESGKPSKRYIMCNLDISSEDTKGHQGEVLYRTERHSSHLFQI